MLKSTQFYGNIVQKIILKSVVINQNAQNVKCLIANRDKHKNSQLLQSQTECLLKVFCFSL